jgi:hypothetical protein
VVRNATKTKGMAAALMSAELHNTLVNGSPGMIERSCMRFRATVLAEADSTLMKNKKHARMSAVARSCT